MTNLFSLDKKIANKEHFETLLQTKSIKIDKIRSHGEHSNDWYEQKRDEWVVLLEGEAHLEFENHQKVTLLKGEHLFIPKQQRHKVCFTSMDALWLAVYFD